MRKALFLDRDGVINQRLLDDYVRHPEQMHVLDDVLPIMLGARQRGYLLILISNQQGVGKGLMSMPDLDRVNAVMQDRLRAVGAELDAIYVCTDLDGTGSRRRKPQPGMLFEAIADHDLDPGQCWFLGDTLTDALAGRAASVHTALVGEHADTDADIVAPTLADIAAPLLVALDHR